MFFLQIFIIGISDDKIDTVNEIIIIIKMTRKLYLNKEIFMKLDAKELLITKISVPPIIFAKTIDKIEITIDSTKNVLNTSLALAPNDLRIPISFSLLRIESVTKLNKSNEEKTPKDIPTIKAIHLILSDILKAFFIKVEV